MQVKVITLIVLLVIAIEAQEKKVEIEYVKCDVVIAGGTTAAFAAAISCFSPPLYSPHLHDPHTPHSTPHTPRSTHSTTPSTTLSTSTTTFDTC
jgi:hypothetical protein